MCLVYIYFISSSSIFLVLKLIPYKQHWLDFRGFVFNLKIIFYLKVWDSPVAQLVKNVPAMWKTWVQSLGWEDPLEKGKDTHSSTLAWRIPWTVQSVGSRELDTTEPCSLSLLFIYQDDLFAWIHFYHIVLYFLYFFLFLFFSID